MITPMLIILFAINSIYVDFTKWRADPISPFLAFAFRYFIPPLYVIYLYGDILIKGYSNIYDPFLIAPYARAGFILFMIPNAIIMIVRVSVKLFPILRKYGAVSCI